MADVGGFPDWLGEWSGGWPGEWSGAPLRPEFFDTDDAIHILPEQSINSGLPIVGFLRRLTRK